METSLFEKVRKLNELYDKSISGVELSQNELSEQRMLRDELISYLKFATNDKN